MSVLKLIFKKNIASQDLYNFQILKRSNKIFKKHEFHQTRKRLHSTMNWAFMLGKTFVNCANK